MRKSSKPQRLPFARLLVNGFTWMCAIGGLLYMPALRVELNEERNLAALRMDPESIPWQEPPKKPAIVMEDAVEPSNVTVNQSVEANAVEAKPVESKSMNPPAEAKKPAKKTRKRRRGKKRPVKKSAKKQPTKKPAKKKPAKKPVTKRPLEFASTPAEELEEKLGLKLDFKTDSPNAPVCSPLSPDQVTFSIVTQTSDNRLWVLREQCKRWKGQISIAVTSERSQEEVQNELVEKWGCSKEQLSLVVRSSESKEDYPVNVMRNLAISNIKTTHFILLDVDFMISETLEPAFQNESVRKAYAEDPKLAAVVPAFEVMLPKNTCTAENAEGCYNEGMKLMPFDFPKLQNLFKSGRVTRFANRAASFTHHSTNYLDWFRQTKKMLSDDPSVEMLKPVPCVTAQMYEPYLATRYCQDMPPFQEQFTGYGFNKVSWLVHVRRAGYKFHQLAGAYTTHFPHPKSESRIEWNRMLDNKKNPLGTKKGRSDRLYVEFLKWMKKSVPDAKRTPDCPGILDVRKKVFVSKEDMAGAFD